MDELQQLGIVTYDYTNLILEYLKIQEQVLLCRTKADYEMCAKKANLYLEEGWYEKFDQLELVDYILKEWVVLIKNCTYQLQSKFNIRREYE